MSQAFTNSNIAGNTIIAFVRMSTSTQTVKLSDTAGNTYVDAVSQAQTTDGHQIHIFYAANIKGGANAVTASFRLLIITPGWQFTNTVVWLPIRWIRLPPRKEMERPSAPD